MRFTENTKELDIDIECDWPDGPPWDADNVNERGIRYRFRKDALWLPIDTFMAQWNITKIYRLGRHYCGKVYYDALNKRWLEGAALDAFLQQNGSVESC